MEYYIAMKNTVRSLAEKWMKLGIIDKHSKRQKDNDCLFFVLWQLKALSDQLMWQNYYKTRELQGSGGTRF